MFELINFFNFEMASLALITPFSKLGGPMGKNENFDPEDLDKIFEFMGMIVCLHGISTN